MTLDPVEALCLQCLRYWWAVVKMKNGSCGELDSNGRPWTRVSGSEAVDWIEQHYESRLAQRQVLRAFGRLESKGFVARERRWKHSYNQSYSYAPPESNDTRDNSPVTTDTHLKTSCVSTDQSNKPDWAKVEDSDDTTNSHPQTDLSTTSPTTSTTKSAAQPKPNKGGRPGAPESPQSSPEVESIGFIRKPGTNSLKAIVERCEGIGKGELPNPWEEGTETRKARQVELGRRLPEASVKRHNTKDNP